METDPRRTKIDKAIRDLWSAFCEAMDDPPIELSNQDLELWEKATMHAAIQERLSEAFEAGRKARERAYD